jgi:hypothetical protein
LTHAETAAALLYISAREKAALSKISSATVAKQTFNSDQTLRHLDVVCSVNHQEDKSFP